MLKDEQYKSFSDAKIVILGSGFSGMLTSLSLASAGFSTIILESMACDDSKFLHDVRTTALTAESKHFLIKLGLWPLVDKIASPILDVYVVDNKSPKMLHFAQNLINTEALGYIVKNSEFKKILLETVQNNPLITLIDKCSDYNIHSQESGNNIYLADGTFISCQLLILCNGRGSTIHTSYFSAEISKHYLQNALTFNVWHQQSHEGTAVEHFLPSGSFAILPLKGENHSSIVWTLPKNYADLLQNLPTDEFEYMVQRNFGDFLGALKIDSEIANFPLRAYLTRKYYHNRIVLIADSAHIIHPLAGQGLNQGIKDIQALTDLINSRNIDQEMLAEYQELRQTDNRLMYFITDNINRIFSNNLSSLKFLRRAALLAAEHISFVKVELLKYAMGRR
ncbi:FAD-dependent monooxygenase [Candidatus Trichorickettsia mobilis]|uniref:FAD-dependent monooxygenase n=1 Tax=Candidatus Trichorickettsia mobilis TaxID=1346319 RepID=UPI00292F4958|nr:FAD-dependent monooxygenase [Candidatus Trichorickettsia mobilis]